MLTRCCLIPLLGILFLCTQPVLAQRSTISGTITDADNGEVLIGAHVMAVTRDKGTVSNNYGFYSLTLPRQDSLTILYSYLGYEPQIKKVYLQDDLVLNITLAPQATLIDEVTVTADRPNDANVTQTQMGVIDVPIRMVKEFPAILGESDVLKVIQLLPGVQAGQEGTTGFHVRGGQADQNLVLLDEAIVYAPNHLFGLFSTFNTNALNSTTLIKGGFPANHGGRLSSVLAITMRDGNKKKYVTQGGVGLLSSHMTFEGPIVKDKASFMLSARRSYADLLVRPFQANKNIYYFYDINAKLNYQLGAKDKVLFSYFRGRDNAEYVGAASVGYGIRFGNSTATLRWNHIFGSKLFANTSLIRNKYFLRISTIQGQFFAQNYTSIEDLSLKTEFEYYPVPSNHLRFGAVVSTHTFGTAGDEGNVIKDYVIPVFNTGNIVPRNTREYVAFINDRWEVGRRFGLNAGLRYTHFEGEGATYNRTEPRISAKVTLNSTSSVKASYTVMNQFVHLIPSTTASLPTDFWITSSKKVKPQYARRAALGYFRNFADNQYETSVEVYYKRMDHQVLLKQGTQLLEYTNIDNELTFGKGWSYGAEFFVKRNHGRYAGWVSYTLAWAKQQFAELNFGKTFPFKYDRRHNLAIAATYDFTDKWTFSADFVFTTGAAYTLPLGRLYATQGGVLYAGLYYDYEKLNNYRLRPYHRLDVAATRTLKPKYFKEADLVISVYNLYSRLNPYYVYLDADFITGQPEARQVSLLPIIPSVGLNFTF